MSFPSDATPWKLDWSDELSVFIPEIDAEHQQFIQLINRLNDAIISRMQPEVIQQCVQAILDDAASHFTHEETLFREWGYPNAHEHALQHEKIILALLDLMKSFQRSGLEYELIDVGLKVKDALINHMLVEDMKYRDFYRGKNHND